MDFRYLEYFMEIAKENNVTRAAANLYVSQSAVNQYLLKLERELGTQLFVRSPRNWHLTEAGRIYLEGCRRALMIKKDTYRQIQDVVESQTSTLTVGLTPIRGLEMFTFIYPSLHDQFPGLKITPIEMDARAQQKAVVNGEIDLGFMILPSALSDHNTYIDLGEEEVILLVPSGLAAELGFAGIDDTKKAGHDILPAADLHRLQGVPFSLTRPGSTFREMCNSIFEDAGFEPEILMETSTTFHIAQITETGQCCGLLPYYYADLRNPHYRCFTLPSHPTWHLYIVHRRDSYLTSAAKAFIKASQNHWKKLNLRPE